MQIVTIVLKVTEIIHAQRTEKELQEAQLGIRGPRGDKAPTGSVQSWHGCKRLTDTKGKV